MKTFIGITLALGLTFVVGCTDEAQLENAQEELSEERQETREEVREAREDGIITEDEREEVAEEIRETQEAAGEVAEQTGDLIESETD